MNNAVKILNNAQHDSTGKVTAENRLSYDSVLEETYTYIADNTDVKQLTVSKEGSKKRQDSIKRMIAAYVESKNPAVAKTEELVYSVEELQQKLVADITQFGVISGPYFDPDVSEIQINDFQTIWVEKSGDVQLLRDEVTGERVTFKDQEECFGVVKKLLRNSKADFSTTDTIAKGRTLEGYRVAAVHPAATAREKGKWQERAPSASAVIRKFPESNFTSKDLVSFKSMSAEMGNVLSVSPKSDLTVLVVGPTGSGKTVLVQLFINGIPLEFRIYASENPSELGIKIYDAKGRPINNVVQYEALADSTEEDKRRASRHTEVALMMQALRMTPHYFVFGEVRFNEEFNQAMVAANTGHKFVTTFHAPDDKGALRRVTNAIQSCNPGMPLNSILEDICANIDIIMCQEKRWDKSRKIMHLTEVSGVEYKDGIATPVMSRIFEFIAERKRPGDKKIRGYHWQMRDWSPVMQDKMVGSIMDITEYDLIATPLKRDASGKEIPLRGHYDTELLLDMQRLNEVGAPQAVEELMCRYAAAGIQPFVETGLDSSGRVMAAPEDLSDMILPGTPSHGKGTPEELAAKAKAIKEEETVEPDRVVSNGTYVGYGTQTAAVIAARSLLYVEQQVEEAGGDPDDIDLGALSAMIGDFIEDVGSDAMRLDKDKDGAKPLSQREGVIVGD